MIARARAAVTLARTIAVALLLLATPQLAVRGEFGEITRRAEAFVARLHAARGAGELEAAV